MRRLVLVEATRGSLEGCAAAMAGSWQLEVLRADLAELRTPLGEPAHTVALVDVGEDPAATLAALEALEPRGLDLIVVLAGLADEPALLRRCLRMGIFEVLSTPVDAQQLRAAVEDGWALLRSASHRPRRSPGDGRLSGLAGFADLLTRDARFQQLLERARGCANRAHPLLLLGEAGTGKDVLAEAIHSAGRRTRPFLRVRAAELERSRLVLGGPWDLLGRARGGTLVVGEMEQLGAPHQGRLLRALRQRADHPDGPRLIFTARCSLEDDLRRGLFRGELYHRLGLELLALPALRERSADIELLAMHMLRGKARPGGPIRSIHAEALGHLMGYGYPCNVSELGTIIDLAAQAEPSGELGASALPSHVRSGYGRSEGSSAPTWRSLDELEREYTQQVLQHTNGNRSEAARILGVSRTGLLGKIKRFAIDIPPEQGS